MFERILQWLKEVWAKMINKTDFKSQMNVDIAVSSLMASKLLTWSNMYLNQAEWIGGEDSIQSLNLPAAIAGEIARAVTIEMKGEITGSARADFLNSVLDSLIPKLRSQIEYGCAKGGLMLKPYVDGQDIAIDFVQADQFYPVSFDANGNISSCVFSDCRHLGAYWYTRLEYHRMVAEGYEISNQAFRSSTEGDLGVSCSLTEVEEWAELEEDVVIQGVENPLYGYFKYPLANSVDPTSPLGISCYARAEDQIKNADIQWTNLLWEFEAGKMALYVDELAFGRDKNNKPILPNKRLYRSIAQDAQLGDEQMFKDWAPTLREQSLLNGLEAILRKIEFLCGLAYGTLSNPQTVDKTATELKISQQRSYSTVTDTQKALRNSLDQLFYAIDVWCSIDSLAPEGTYEAVYYFDDSIVTDTDTQFAQDSKLVTLGVMSKVEFRMRTLNEDEKTATEKVAAASAEQAASATDLFGNPLPPKNRTPVPPKAG